MMKLKLLKAMVCVADVPADDEGKQRRRCQSA